MADYTVSTNLISWIPAMHGIFGWPDNGHEAEVVRGMNVGDWLVPKFAQGPTAQDQEDYQREIAAVMNDDFDARLTEYMDKVNGGGSSGGRAPSRSSCVSVRSAGTRIAGRPPNPGPA